VYHIYLCMIYLIMPCNSQGCANRSSESNHAADDVHIDKTCNMTTNCKKLFLTLRTVYNIKLPQSYKNISRSTSVIVFGLWKKYCANLHVSWYNSYLWLCLCNNTDEVASVHLDHCVAA
jgi:hypothetical protein